MKFKASLFLPSKSSVQKSSSASARIVRVTAKENNRTSCRPNGPGFLSGKSTFFFNQLIQFPAIAKD